jgi:cytochrome c oxidase cbb3-type subunit 3
MKVLDDEKDLLLDHEYDGIKELDNHMPVWWLWLFYFTIGWGFVYLVYYQFTGVGPDQHEQYEQEMAAAAELYGQDPGEPSGSEVAAVSWEFETDQASIDNGKEVFMSTNNLCFTCHGANGEGLVGPNLTDNMWLHGCSAEEIAVSISTGFPDKGMVAYGSGTPISEEDMTDVISYIASIQGTNPANAKAVDQARAVECTIE